MAKPRSRLQDYAVYLLLRVILCVLQSLSFRIAKQVAKGLAWLLYHVDKRHRLVALENLQHAFGDSWSAEKRDQVVRQVYLHFCTMLIEIVQMPRILQGENWKRSIRLVGGEKILHYLTQERPLFFVTGHFGNWELGGFVLGLLGFSTHAIARELDNPYVDRLLRSFRQRTGQGLLAKQGDFDQMQAILAQKGVIATLGDQDAGQKGLFVEFFGRPASTHKAIALLSLEYNVPMIVTGMPRVGENFRYDIVAEDVLDPADYAGRPDAIPAMTERFTQALERLIRRHPEQYFWLHRRWKHQPPVRKAKKSQAA